MTHIAWIFSGFVTMSLLASPLLRNSTFLIDSAVSGPLHWLPTTTTRCFALLHTKNLCLLAFVNNLFKFIVTAFLCCISIVFLLSAAGSAPILMY